MSFHSDVTQLVTWLPALSGWQTNDGCRVLCVLCVGVVERFDTFLPNSSSLRKDGCVVCRGRLYQSACRRFHRISPHSERGKTETTVDQYDQT